MGGGGGGGARGSLLLCLAGSDGLVDRCCYLACRVSARLAAPPSRVRGSQAAHTPRLVALYVVGPRAHLLLVPNVVAQHRVEEPKVGGGAVGEVAHHHPVRLAAVFVNLG